MSEPTPEVTVEKEKENNSPVFAEKEKSADPPSVIEERVELPTSHEERAKSENAADIGAASLAVTAEAAPAAKSSEAPNESEKLAAINGTSERRDSSSDNTAVKEEGATRLAKQPDAVEGTQPKAPDAPEDEAKPETVTTPPATAEDKKETPPATTNDKKETPPATAEDHKKVDEKKLVATTAAEPAPADAAVPAGGGKKAEEPAKATSVNDEKSKQKDPSIEDKAVSKEKEADKAPKSSSTAHTSASTHKEENATTKPSPSATNSPPRSNSPSTHHASTVNRSANASRLSHHTPSRAANSSSASNNKSLPPLRLTPAQQDRSVEHLYTQSLARRKATLESLEKTHHKSMVVFGSGHISQEEAEYMTKRLFADSVEQKRKALERMTNTAVEKQLKQAGVGKHFESPEREKSSVKRLYDTIQRDREISQKLFEKYNPPKKRIVKDVAELHENDKRFYEGNFGRKV